MPSFPTLTDFTKAVHETTNVSVLWSHAVDFANERGIEMLSYHSDDAQRSNSKPLTVLTHGFPQTWVCQYMERELSLIDPIPKLATVAGRPFRWSETPRLVKLDEDGLKYMEILAASNLGDGIAMQVYGPNMRNAYVGLGFGETDPDLSPERIFELQCAAQIAHLRYCELTEHRQDVPEALTPRETEILQWIARGKSTSVIADILGISNHTVDTLTRRVYRKLDVNDRTTAAIRGLGAGLVGLRRGRVV